MKASHVVVLSSIASEGNAPGEYLLAVVHPQTGRLIQASGTDAEVAELLVDLAGKIPSLAPVPVPAREVPRCPQCHSPIQRDLRTGKPYCIASPEHRISAVLPQGWMAAEFVQPSLVSPLQHVNEETHG